MPQLMPLMWVFSTIMICFLLLMSYYLFYMKNFMAIVNHNNDLLFIEMDWEW